MEKLLNTIFAITFTVLLAIGAYVPWVLAKRRQATITAAFGMTRIALEGGGDWPTSRPMALQFTASVVNPGDQPLRIDRWELTDIPLIVPLEARVGIEVVGGSQADVFLTARPDWISWNLLSKSDRPAQFRISLVMEKRSKDVSIISRGARMHMTGDFIRENAAKMNDRV